MQIARRITPARRALATLLIALAATPCLAQNWAPAGDKIKTRWAADVSPDNVLPEYPRPQMARDTWVNLNGLWDYAIRGWDVGAPDRFDGEILVPFAIESSLSGVMKRVGPESRLWYRRTFTVPSDWRAEGNRVLLHFGAVDWQAAVHVNGHDLGTHTGGYAPFTLDITDALVPGDSQQLVVSVFDPSDTGYQPRGKQVNDPGDIWYTPVTGIWQTVWLEPVPETSIDRLTLTPDVDNGALRVTTHPRGPAPGHTVRITARAGSRTVATAVGVLGQMSELTIDAPRLWSPDTPFLYDLTVEVLRDGQVVDAVDSYFAMRKIALAPDAAGTLRLHLNNEPLFQFGPLDQGWWPDGLYTAPTDEALLYDLQITKQLGFNMARKHVKVEPARWYYHADRLGLLVWQDMPNGDRHAEWDPNGTHDGTETTRSAQSMMNYYHEWDEIITALYNHPSIIMWVPYNEGWGQANTVQVTEWTMRRDPSRLVNPASGGNDFPVGHVVDLHRYPGPAAPLPAPGRAGVLGEYGGLGLPLPGHTWQDEENWGYRTLSSREELNARYADMLRSVRLYAAAPGISAAIYTQTTDVEVEVNGAMTYDRAVLKLDPDRVAPLTRKLYAPAPTVTTLSPTSMAAPVAWRYTTQSPPDDWMQPAFNDSAWTSAGGAFGRAGTVGARFATAWETNDIWLRRSFELDAMPTGKLYLMIIHDEDATVYINGVEVATRTGHIPDYHFVPLGENAAAALRTGRNTIAVHCRQTGGGQSIDVGLVAIDDPAWQD